MSACLKIFASRFRYCHVCLMLGLGVIGVASAQGDNRYEEKSEYAVAGAGADPRRYVTARAQNAAEAAARAFDASAEKTVKEIESRLAAGAGPEAAEVWVRLQVLNPYAGSEPLRQTVEGWAAQCAKNIHPGADIAEDVLRQANSDYRRGEPQGLVDASAGYRKLLEQNPAHLDARNNLALVELHRDNPVAAMLELAILRKMEPSYVPARLNLTVLLERVGRTREAAALAKETAAICTNLPAAVYNQAWFEDATGDRAAARLTLSSLKKAPSTDNITKLRDLSLRPYVPIPSSARDGAVDWGRGLSGMLFNRNVSNLMYLRIPAFIAWTAVLLFLTRLFARPGSYSGRGKRGFLWFAVLGFAGFMLWCGFRLANAGWACLYILALGGIAARLTRR
jgi:hypothetical protein